MSGLLSKVTARNDRAGSQRRPGRGTNLALLVLLPLAVLTGLFANTIGTDWLVHPATVHGIIALAIAGLSPWKSAIVRRGLRRWTRATWASLALLCMILAALVSGLGHAGGYQGPLGPLTVMQVHIGAALIAIALVIAHFRAHPVRPRRQDLGRRAFLNATAVAALATGAWIGLEAVIEVAGLPGRSRRFTGSHQRGSFDPQRLPVTSWLDDSVQHISSKEWRIQVNESELTLEDLRTFELEDVPAILDCTSAWYSEQLWSGVRLDRLVEHSSARSVVVRSATGYARRFPTRDLERMWLVTHVGGDPLSAGHGFPARIVAPGRRGFWWVKWVTEITTSDVAWWLQPPFPVT